MSNGAFHPGLDQLPGSLPVFPLEGVLLLPACRLPLNVFEPRYLQMVQDVLGDHRMIGMIQPREEESTDESRPRPLHAVGCAGRIVAFRETADGRFLVTLKGVCRFCVDDEPASDSPYRSVVPGWSRFSGDLDADDVEIDRERLVGQFRTYSQNLEIEPDWEVVESTSDVRLVNSLSMICPFDPDEKQALLEAKDVTDRYEVLVGLLEMANLYETSDPLSH